MTHLLIVEDQEEMSLTMERLLEPLAIEKITHVKSLAEARVVIAEEPPPDATILDLLLIAADGTSNTPEEVISAIPEFQKRTLVMIVTGYPDNAKNVTIPVVGKDNRMTTNLPLTLARLLLSRTWNKADAGFARLEAIERELSHASAK